MYLGIDFGTSGCRAVVIDEQQSIIAEVTQTLPLPEHHQGRIQQKASAWGNGLHSLLQQLSKQMDLSRIKRLALDGTSGTILLCDEQCKPLTAALMYNDSSSHKAVKTIRQYCPSDQHITMTASSGLAKAIQLLQSKTLPRKVKILNQADYLTNTLCGLCGISDQHNALKLGYDVQRQTWPEWIVTGLPSNSLPKVLQPGEIIGNIKSKFVRKYGFSEDCQVCAGTTDSNAAFMATLSTRTGDAVTSLGTTLVVKILNDKPVEELDSGVYSHKLGDRWLVGGSSNAGAGILRKFFTDQKIADYSAQMNIHRPTGLDFYPLSTVGERFPINDPDKKPLLTPRPDSNVKFLQAILEGLSKIEKTGYEKLEKLGVSKPLQVQTCGGGAKNPKWNELRRQLLGVPVSPASNTEASFGSALLALHGLKPYSRS